MRWEKRTIDSSGVLKNQDLKRRPKSYRGALSFRSSRFTISTMTERSLHFKRPVHSLRMWVNLDPTAGGPAMAAQQDLVGFALCDSDKQNYLSIIVIVTSSHGGLWNYPVQYQGFRIFYALYTYKWWNIWNLSKQIINNGNCHLFPWGFVKLSGTVLRISHQRLNISN